MEHLTDFHSISPSWRWLGLQQEAGASGCLQQEAGTGSGWGGGSPMDWSPGGATPVTTGWGPMGLMSTQAGRCGQWAPDRNPHDLGGHARWEVRILPSPRAMQIGTPGRSGGLPPSPIPPKACSGPFRPHPTVDTCHGEGKLLPSPQKFRSAPLLDRGLWGTPPPPLPTSL